MAPALYNILALGVGLGGSSAVTFLSFLCFNGLHQQEIIAIHSLLIMTFLLFNLPHYRRTYHQFHSNVFSLKAFNNCWRAWMVNLFFWGIFIFLTKIIYTLARSHPFGEWDAWALWNMKTKFLILGGSAWQNLFQLHWHTQPDYPLFLPFLNVWVHTISNAPLQKITIATSVVFTMLTGALLFIGLKKYIPPFIAGLASLILLTNRYYLFMATAQYADIVLGFYLLLSLIVLTITLREKICPWRFFLGLSAVCLCLSRMKGSSSLCS